MVIVALETNLLVRIRISFPSFNPSTPSIITQEMREPVSLKVVQASVVLSTRPWFHENQNLKRTVLYEPRGRVS